MKKLFKTVQKYVAAPFKWIAKRVFMPMFGWLQLNLDGKDTLKDELRKLGWGLMAIGVTGTLVQDKPLAYLIALGVVAWLIGLIENVERSKNE